MTAFGEKFSQERIAPGGETYLVHFVPLKNEQGEVESGLILAIDISERKQAETALRARSQALPAASWSIRSYKCGAKECSRATRDSP